MKDQSVVGVNPQSNNAREILLARKKEFLLYKAINTKASRININVCQWEANLLSKEADLQLAQIDDLRGQTVGDTINSKQEVMLKEIELLKVNIGLNKAKIEAKQHNLGQMQSELSNVENMNEKTYFALKQQRVK